jgi:hypothetical protein
VLIALRLAPQLQKLAKQSLQTRLRKPLQIKQKKLLTQNSERRVKGDAGFDYCVSFLL